MIHRISDDSDSDIPKRSHSAYFKVLDLIRKLKKIVCLRLVSSTVRTDYPWRRKKKNHAPFFVAPQAIKVKATVCDKCLVNMEENITFLGRRHEQKMHFDW